MNENTIYVFSGIPNIEMNRTVRHFSLSIKVKNKKIQIPASQIEENIPISNHRINLFALLHALKLLNELNTFGDDLNIVYSCMDDLVIFEWEKEYRTENMFSPNTADIDLWNLVIAEVKNNKLTLVNKNSANGGVDLLESIRIRRQEER